MFSFKKKQQLIKQIISWLNFLAFPQLMFYANFNFCIKHYSVRDKPVRVLPGGIPGAI